MELTVTKNNFEKEVLNSEIPVLVDFWAAWCGPCKMVAPAVASLAEELSGKVTVAKINIDEQQDLAMKYGVMSIPTFILFKGGKVAAQTAGAMSKDALKDALGL